MATTTLNPTSGSLRGDRHVLPLRVYYEDTDFSGIVYHASYLRFFERGRTELLRTLGFHQAALLTRTDAPLVFAVRRMTLDFLRSAQMDDVILVETRPLELRAATIELEQRISHGSDRLAECRVTIVALGNGRPRRIPSVLRSAFDRVLASGDQITPEASASGS